MRTCVCGFLKCDLRPRTCKMVRSSFNCDTWHDFSRALHYILWDARLMHRRKPVCSDHSNSSSVTFKSKLPNMPALCLRNVCVHFLQIVYVHIIHLCTQRVCWMRAQTKVHTRREWSYLSAMVALMAAAPKPVSTVHATTARTLFCRTLNRNGFYCRHQPAYGLVYRTHWNRKQVHTMC